MSTNARARYTLGSVVIEDFSPALFPKIQDPEIVAELTESAQSWTAGNEPLTQLIYKYIRQYSAQIIQTEGANNIVNEIVCQKIIKNWRNNAAAALLCPIEQTLNQFERQDTLLVLYLQILWRGGIAANNKRHLSAEQNTLLRSNLVTLTEGQLQLSNRIYAIVFGMDWIEQQLPGLTTRTVHIPTNISAEISTATPAEIPRQAGMHPGAVLTLSKLVSSKLNKRLSATVLISSGAVSLGFVAVASFKAYDSVGFAAQPQKTKSPIAHSVSYQPRPKASVSQSKSPKDLFDQGLIHATNGRWLPMIKQYCSIPQTSTYFAPAKRQVEHWIKLYPQDIQRANITLLTTQKTPCELIENALQSVK